MGESDENGEILHFRSFCIVASRGDDLFGLSDKEITSILVVVGVNVLIII